MKKPRKPAPVPPSPTPTSAPPTADPRSLRTPAQLLGLIEKTVRAIVDESMSEQRARLLLYGAQVGTAAVRCLITDEKLQDIIRRLDELERK